MCKNEGDKAKSRVPPCKTPYLFEASLRRGENGEEGLFEGEGYWNIQKKVSILQKELELELVK